MKRDGNTVLVSTWHDLIYDENSTERATGVLRQIQFIPTLAKLLQDSPDQVIADLEEIRKYSECAIVGQPYVFTTTPSDRAFWCPILRSGQCPSASKSAPNMGQIFRDIFPSKIFKVSCSHAVLTISKEIPLAAVPLARETLSELGKNPIRKVCVPKPPKHALLLTCVLQAVVMSLPTVESSYVMHTTKGIHGFDHPEYPVIRVALEVLNATEGFLWVSHSINSLYYPSYTKDSVTFVGLVWLMEPMCPSILKPAF